MKPHPAEEILDFWLKAGPAKWYAKDDAFDEEIRHRFGHLWEKAAQGDLTHWTSAPRTALAVIILLDQFPRNMFRNDGRAFSTDGKAKSAACYAIDRGWDMRIAEPERQFFYMPFMHSENSADQDHCVRLMLERLPETGAENVLHARAHREVIRRFGRFPHRNADLGRTSTAAERSFLEAGGYGAVVEELKKAA